MSLLPFESVHGFVDKDDIVQNPPSRYKSNLRFRDQAMDHFPQSVGKKVRDDFVNYVSKAYWPVVSNHRWIFNFGIKATLVWLISFRR